MQFLCKFSSWKYVLIWPNHFISQWIWYSDLWKLCVMLHMGLTTLLKTLKICFHILLHFCCPQYCSVLSLAALKSDINYSEMCAGLWFLVAHKNEDFWMLACDSHRQLIVELFNYASIYHLNYCYGFARGWNTWNSTTLFSQVAQLKIHQLFGVEWKELLKNSSWDVQEKFICKVHWSSR